MNLRVTVSRGLALGMGGWATLRALSDSQGEDWHFLANLYMSMP